MPRFVDRTGDISHVYSGGWEHFVGGGLAAFDCDADNFPDLYAAGGETPAVLLRNRTGARGQPIVFEPATPDALRLTGVVGAYPLDIDADGWQDLVVLSVGPNRVLKGGPDCSFTPMDLPGLSFAEDWSTAFSATWEDRNTLPTLAFGNYVDREDPEGPFEACDANVLWRPEGVGYGAPIRLEPGFCALSILFTDWGRQGRADLRISNDRHYYVRGGEEQMWAMETVPRLYTEADGWRSYQLWGMGIASRDITGDGRPEVYLTSMGDQRLQILEEGATGPAYADATYDRGTTAHRPHIGGDGRPSTGWHVAFGDVQNDGRDDIFIAKGNVDQMPGNAMEDPNSLLLQQADGRFSEAGDRAGIATMERSRGAAMLDLNLDGLLDVAVVNRRSDMEIWENATADTGRWLVLRLTQPGVNRDAVGAWVEVETGSGRQVREITVGGGHAGGVSGPEHFGLAEADTARIRVIWPDGTVSDWHEVGADQILRVSRAADSLEISAY